MRKHIYLLGVAGLVLAVGCSDTRSAPKDPASSGPDSSGTESGSQDEAPTIDDVRETVGEADEVAGDFTAKEMQHSSDALSGKMQEFDRQLDQLQQKGSNPTWRLREWTIFHPSH